MHLVFIDYSQQQNPPPRGLGHLLAIGAVVIPEQQLSKFASARVNQAADAPGLLCS